MNCCEKPVWQSVEPFTFVTYINHVNPRLYVIVSERSMSRRIWHKRKDKKSRFRRSNKMIINLGPIKSLPPPYIIKGYVYNKTFHRSVQSHSVSVGSTSNFSGPSYHPVSQLSWVIITLFTIAETPRSQLWLTFNTNYYMYPWRPRKWMFIVLYHLLFITGFCVLSKISFLCKRNKFDLKLRADKTPILDVASL